MLQRYEPAVVAPFALLVPVAGLASAWVWLGERLSPVQFAAGGLVMGGLALNLLWRASAAPTNATVRV